MTVIITFAGISGGDSLSDTIDIGPAMDPGDISIIQDVFIRHDAEAAPITNCAFYLTKFAGGFYPGTDPDADYVEVISWGDNIADKGAQLNQVVPALWAAPTSFWVENPTGETFASDSGTIDSPIILSEHAIVQGTAETGKIARGGEAHVQFRMNTPEVASITRASGYRAISLVFAYSATS